MIANLPFLPLRKAAKKTFSRFKIQSHSAERIRKSIAQHVVEKGWLYYAMTKTKDETDEAPSDELMNETLDELLSKMGD